MHKTLVPTSAISLPILDLNNFKELIERIKQGSKTEKILEIKNLLTLEGLINHHLDKHTRCIVLAECKKFDYTHEYHTAQKLTAANYNVVFVPKGYFKREEKKFDVFLCREHLFFESELKCITTKNPDTIGKRIKSGSEQSPRIILDITSDIHTRRLIDGLKLGCDQSRHLLEILLLYRSKFYRLPKTQVLSNKIYNVLK